MPLNRQVGFAGRTRRKTRHAAFKSLLGIAVEKPPVTYNMLIKPEGAG